MSTVASGSGTVAEAEVDPAVGLAAGAGVGKLEGAGNSAGVREAAENDNAMR